MAHGPILDYSLGASGFRGSGRRGCFQGAGSPLALARSVCNLNLAGDGLRHWLDPKDHQ
jgi:hypothetical protein